MRKSAKTHPQTGPTNGGVRIRFFWATVALTAAIGALPLSWKVALGTRGILHRPLHTIAFATLCGLAIWGLESRETRLLRASAVFVFGFLLETMQHLVYRNAFEWRDCLADGIGVCLALIATELQGRPVRGKRISHEV
jgi:hypothetical protein